MPDDAQVTVLEYRYSNFHFLLLRLASLSGHHRSRPDKIWPVLPRQLSSTPGDFAWLRSLLLGSLAAFAVYYVAVSLHWPLAVDSPVMHYVVFLMRHGLRPYLDITDNNLPGAYLTESWAMSVFGASDLAWRLYEFFLLAVLAASLVIISLPYDWLAGLLAAGLFLLVHGSEGPYLAVEREQVIAALLAVGYATLFLSVRRRTPWLMLVFGLATALAGSIKPTFAPLGLALLALAFVALRRRSIPPFPYVAWALAGFASITGLILAFFLHYHALSAFLFLSRRIIPSYVALYPPNQHDLLLRIFPHSLIPVALLAIALAFVSRTRWNWEHWALLLAAAFGVFSWFAQGKAFLHHRYVLFTFLALLFALEITPSLRRPGRARLLAASALLYVSLVAVPYFAWQLHLAPTRNYLAPALVADLTALAHGHPETLQGQVQCFDLVSGCLNALYHLNLVENSAFTGDLLLFQQHDSLASRFYRDLFRQRAAQHPATVLVLGNEWFGQPNSFDKINTWPEFARSLTTNYTEVLTRSFPAEALPSPVRGAPYQPPAYRIYVRNSSPLLKQPAVSP